MDDRSPQSLTRRCPKTEKSKLSKPAFLSSSSRFLDGGAASSAAASRREKGGAAVKTPITPSRSNGSRQALGRSPLSGAASQPVSRRTKRNLPGASGGTNSCSSLLSPPGRSPPAHPLRHLSSSVSSSSSSSSSPRSTARNSVREVNSRSTPLPRPVPQVPFHGRRLNMESIAEVSLSHSSCL